MYKNDMEAAQARITALEAELEAETQRRQAAEAEARAAQARLDEAELQLRKLAATVPTPQSADAGRQKRVAIIGAVFALLAALGGMLVVLLNASSAPQPVQPASYISRPPQVPAAPLPPEPRPALPGPTRGNAQQISLMQRKHRAALRGCYMAAFKQDPTLTKVRVDVELDVSADGEVAEATARSPEAGDLARCIRETVLGWTFPAGQAGIIGFPIIFRGGTSKTPDVP